MTGSGGTKTLKLDTYVESYALVTGDRTSDVVFTVGGNVSYASSKAIRLDNVPLTQTFLGSTSVDVTSGTDVPGERDMALQRDLQQPEHRHHRGGGHPSH